MSGVVLLVSRAADSKVIHELIMVLLYLLFPQCWDICKKPSCCSKSFTAAQLCTVLTFSKKQEAAAKLPACFEPLNMSAAAIPQMAGGEGREGQLFNPLQCKHDPFEWRGISQDILVWADLPKQPQTTVALCLSFGGKSLRYEISLSLSKSEG